MCEETNETIPAETIVFEIKYVLSALSNFDDAFLKKAFENPILFKESIQKLTVRLNHALELIGKQ